MRTDRSLLFFTEREIVRFTVVRQHPALLPEPSHGSEQFDPLVPGNRAVVVVRHDQERRRDLINKEEGGILDVQITLVPQSPADTTLVLFVLKTCGSCRIPADLAVRAGHVRDRRTRHCRPEHRCLRDEIGRLVASPALSLKPDPGGINESRGNEFSHAGDNAFISALPGWPTR